MKDAKVKVGADIGGTHISAALVGADGKCRPETYVKLTVDPMGNAVDILDTWAKALWTVIAMGGGAEVEGIGIAMPGPFAYEQGTAMIKGMAKYESLFGINVREALLDRLYPLDIPVVFENDAVCFGLGEMLEGHKRVLAVTLGTGIGACFLVDGKVVKDGPGVPSRGYLYDYPFMDGRAEDYISARWLLQCFSALSGQTVNNVRELAELAGKQKPGVADTARSVFRLFGANLGQLLAARMRDFGGTGLVIGGSISKCRSLFEASMREAMDTTDIYFSDNTEYAAIAGAAALPAQALPHSLGRRTKQPPLPRSIEKDSIPSKGYRLYPFESLGTDRIFSGYASLAAWMVRTRHIRIDGFAGVDWAQVRTSLCKELRALGVKVLWFDTQAFLSSEAEIEERVRPFLGKPGSVWGTRTTLGLSDLFTNELHQWAPSAGDEVVVLSGTGAALSHWPAPVIYIDLPKNELQYRMRAGSAFNLGSTRTEDFAEMYKRAYFVDWPMLNKHRVAIKDAISVIVDAQWETEINWANAFAISEGLRTISGSMIRNRPWFEPGVWGGQWMKRHLPGISQEEVNYAWSFELIAPENGLVFEGDGHLLEIAFDWLMEAEGERVLGVDAGRFGTEFPIRFDFLDTVGGDNLSIQCHPSLPYIREQFGETITQDETYYILDKAGDAAVYLGFKEDIDPAVFRAELQRSQQEKTPIDIERYVRRLPAAKHDLFLIPNRTVHGAGRGNLVLEISATPYIFTFKMYDWMRLDLNGRPRPINIEHAFHNLDFERKGARVEQELISRPLVLSEKEGIRWEELPTHPELFFTVHRVSLSAKAGKTSVKTEGKFHLLMLVEGESLLIKTQHGKETEVRYAETFLIPAAAETYELINLNHTPLKIVCASIKK